MFYLFALSFPRPSDRFISRPFEWKNGFWMKSSAGVSAGGECNLNIWVGPDRNGKTRLWYFLEETLIFWIMFNGTQPVIINPVVCQPCHHGVTQTTINVNRTHMTQTDSVVELLFMLVSKTSCCIWFSLEKETAFSSSFTNRHSSLPLFSLKSCFPLVVFIRSMRAIADRQKEDE